MVKLIYYKLPSDAGENVLVMEHYLYPDSEIAVLIEENDLRLPFFKILYDTEDEGSSPIAIYVPRDDADTPHEPYFVVDDTGITGLLPFKNAHAARSFMVECLNQYQQMKEKFDA